MLKAKQVEAGFRNDDSYKGEGIKLPEGLHILCLHCQTTTHMASPQGWPSELSISSYPGKKDSARLRTCLKESARECNPN